MLSKNIEIIDVNSEKGVNRLNRPFQQLNRHRQQPTRHHRKTPQTKNSECLCGKKHRFSRCFCLIEEIRPAGWKLNQAIQQQIESKLQNPRLKAAVDRAQAWVQKNQQRQQKDKETPAETATNKTSRMRPHSLHPFRHFRSHPKRYMHYTTASFLIRSQPFMFVEKSSDFCF